MSYGPMEHCKLATIQLSISATSQTSGANLKKHPESRALYPTLSYEHFFHLSVPSLEPGYKNSVES